MKCAFLSSKTFLVSKQNHVTYFSRISAKHIAVRLRLLLSICLVLSKRKENTTHCLELLPSMDFQKEFCLCPPDFSTAGNKQNNLKNQNNPSPNNKIYFSYYGTPVELIDKLLLYLKFLVAFCSLKC